LLRSLRFVASFLTVSAGGMQHSSLTRQLQVIWLLLGMLWAGTRSCQPRHNRASDGHAVYDFGLHLFQLGDYYRAITELTFFSALSRA
jgi:hypothetical protein